MTWVNWAASTSTIHRSSGKLHSNRTCVLAKIGGMASLIKLVRDVALRFEMPPVAKVMSFWLNSLDLSVASMA